MGITVRSRAKYLEEKLCEKRQQQQQQQQQQHNINNNNNNNPNVSAITQHFNSPQNTEN